jgi:hypothetical protein
VAILPLYQWSSRPLHIVRFLGHGPSDQLGPISAPGDRNAAATTLRQALSGRAPDLFIGERMPGDEQWAKRLDGTHPQA